MKERYFKILDCSDKLIMARNEDFRKFIFLRKMILSKSMIGNVLKKIKQQYIWLEDFIEYYNKYFDLDVLVISILLKELIWAPEPTTLQIQGFEPIFLEGMKHNRKFLKYPYFNKK